MPSTLTMATCYLAEQVILQAKAQTKKVVYATKKELFTFVSRGVHNASLIPGVRYFEIAA